MEEVLIEWIKENPAFAEDSDDSYHNRKQMMEFAKYYYKKQLSIHGVVGQSEQLCECDTPLIRTNIKGGEYCALCGKELC